MKVVATKATIAVIESEENDKKILATLKLMLQQNNELKTDIFVATIKAVESEISFSTEKFYVETQYIREVR